MQLEPEAAQTDDDDAAQACQACGHELAAHDPVAIRYCQASTAQGNKRGCLCPKTSAAGPAAAPTPAYGRGRFSGR